METGHVKKKYELKEIELDKIVVPEERISALQDEQSEAALLESIKRFGLLQEIGVIEQPDGSYKLIYGQSRLNALKQAGYRRYTVKVWNVDEREAILLMLAENFARGGIDPAKAMDLIQELMEKHGLTAKEISMVTGISEATIAKLKKISHAHPTVKALVIQGDLDWTKAYEISKIPDEALQEHYAIQTVEQGYDTETVKEIVQAVNRYLQESETVEEQMLPQGTETAPPGTDLCDLCKQRHYQENMCYPGLCKQCWNKVKVLIAQLEATLIKKFKDTTLEDLSNIIIAKTQTNPQPTQQQNQQNKQTQQKLQA